MVFCCVEEGETPARPHKGSTTIKGSYLDLFTTSDAAEPTRITQVWPYLMRVQRTRSGAAPQFPRLASASDIFPVPVSASP